MNEKKKNKVSKRDLWSNKFVDDKLKSETSNKKQFRYKLSPNNNLCLRAFLGPF